MPHWRVGVLQWVNVTSKLKMETQDLWQDITWICIMFSVGAWTLHEPHHTKNTIKHQPYVTYLDMSYMKQWSYFSWHCLCCQPKHHADDIIFQLKLFWSYLYSICVLLLSCYLWYQWLFSQLIVEWTIMLYWPFHIFTSIQAIFMEIKTFKTTCLKKSDYQFSFYSSNLM